MGEDVPDEYLAHLSPLEWEHITLTGVYRWNLDSSLAQSEEFRPLRKPAYYSQVDRTKIAGSLQAQRIIAAS